MSVQDLVNNEIKKRQVSLLSKIGSGIKDVYNAFKPENLAVGVEKTGESILGGLKSMGQASLRGYASLGPIASLGTSKPLTPQGKFQQELYGTDKPITLRSFGSEIGINENRKITPFVGFALGAADLIPGGEETKAGAIKLLRNADKVEDAFKILTKTMGVAKDVAKEYAPIAAKLTDEVKLGKLVDEVVQKSQSVSRILEKGKQLFSSSKGLAESEQLAKPAEQILPKISESVISPTLSPSPNLQDVSSFYNLDRLNIDNEAKTAIQNEINGATEGLKKTVGARLSNQEVIDLATSTSKVLNKTVTREQTATKIASNLRLRQEIAASAQNGKIDQNFINLWLKDKAAGEDIARQLQARRINADPIETGFIDTVLQAIYKVNKNADEIAAAAKNVDFNNLEQVTEFYRTFVKPKASEWLDLLRYNSMLTSPNTHIINTVSNFQGTGVIAPIEKTISGVIDATRSALTGKPRQYAIGEGATYAQGFYSSLGEASQRFMDVMRGKKPIGNPDIRQIPLATKGVKKVVEKTLNLPMRALEAMDQFFKVATEGGLEQASRYAESKGIVRTGETASEEASRRLFRYGSTKQGTLLNAIDGLTNGIMHVRNSDNPILSTMAKFTLPFVRTPTELLKQGIEYSPLGLTTLPGAANKIEQLSKVIIGTASALGVATLLGQDRLTWASPVNAKQKADFSAAGRQAYSVKIGNKWVSYSKLHPALAFNFALIAAIDDSLKQQRLNESDADSILQAFGKYGNFIADQSYLKNVGDFVAGIKGDAGGFSKLISNYPQQLIPFRALMSWVERLTDPYQRQIDTNGTFLDKQMQQVMLQIPGLGEKLPTKKGTFGEPLKNQNRVLNAFSPARVSETNPFGEATYQLDQTKSKVDKFKKDLKDVISSELKFRLQ